MELVAEKRDKFGKGTKSIRRKGMVPAELYGHGIKNVHISVNADNFLKLFKSVGENTIVNLVVDGGKHSVLIHDVQRNFLSGDVEHIDFYEVRMDEKVTAHIPIELVGESPAVKEKGGILNKSLLAVEVEALPGDLPHNFVLDIGGLDDFDKHLYVKDITIPKGVRIITNPDAGIARVSQPVVEKEETTEEPIDVSQVKVEGEEKKAERDAKKLRLEGTERTGASVQEKLRLGETPRTGANAPAKASKETTPK